MPKRAAGAGKRARSAALRVVDRFGYLQLDTVSIAGARSHALVLLSRIEGFDPTLGEELLRPGEPLFEYWGHEASWLPIDLYPVFAFRRRAYRRHPWWGDLLSRHRRVANEVVARIRAEGPLRSIDLEGEGSRGWWNLKLTKKVANALWGTGVLAIRERKRFQRSYDLAERVIPAELLQAATPTPEAIKILLLRALSGHGWAPSSTLAQTWRMRNLRREVRQALSELAEDGAILPCELVRKDRRHSGWIRPVDLELTGRLLAARPRRDRGTLLSPFDPVLWDRDRVQALFDFHQILEIFKPARDRRYGYFCLPVLAGENLVARFDLKAHRPKGRLEVIALHPEHGIGTAGHHAARVALERYSRALDLEPDGGPFSKEKTMKGRSIPNRSD